jgi:UDP-2-acetamido-3-amino-2,3-dideoxy-glucuronate N-acetyltransferase
MNESNDKGYFVHPSSYVDEGAEIGEGTTIWHFSHVCTGAQIGPRCRIGQNVLIGPGVWIGANVKIQNNVSVYTGVVLEDDVFCGPSMVFTNVSVPRSAIPRNTAADFSETRVRRGATIGANATIVCGHTIGEHAFIGAGSVVTRDVPDHALVYGNPARQHGYACECGLRLTTDRVENGKKLSCQCGRTYEMRSGEVKRIVS